MMSEYLSLTRETEAIEPVDVSSLDENQVEFVPGKLVCTIIKAGPNGGMRKCRAVKCGNMVSEAVDRIPGSDQGGMSPYASGADGILTRASLPHGVQRNWGASVVDIKTAFLLAPRPAPEHGREAIVVPPKILVQAGICKASERWKVSKGPIRFTNLSQVVGQPP